MVLRIRAACHQYRTNVINVHAVVMACTEGATSKRGYRSIVNRQLGPF
jgi:hypothetical protein